MLATLTLVTLSFGFATDSAAGDGEKRLVDVEDYFSQSYVSDCEVSPDGKRVAYVESRWQPPQESRNSDLWYVSKSGGDARRLTFHSGSDGHPTWSGDSRDLFFTSSRKRDDAKPPYNGKTQLWRIRVDTGVISPVTQCESGINSYQVARDAVYYTVDAKSGKDEWSDLRAKFDTVNYGGGKRNTSELWRLDLRNWRSEKVVGDELFIREFAVTTDESKIAMIVAKDDLLITHEGWSSVDVLDVASGKTETVQDSLWRAQADSPHGWIEQLAWSGNGKRLAFRVVYDGYPARQYCFDAGNKKVWQLNHPADVTIASAHIQWHGDRVLFIGEQKARQHLYEIDNVGKGNRETSRALTRGDIVVSEFSVAKTDGSICIIKAEPDQGVDLFWATDQSQPKRLTTINPQMDSWKLPQTSIVSWKSSDGTTAEGILELPPGYKKSDGPLPTIVHLHGGPTSATRYAFQFWPYGRTLLPSKGYALFSPNYRGSTGYGDKFMVELIGRENDIDVEDIMTGVDAMVASGVADPKRLGVMGWSNGGFLTNALIAHTTRFKAASSGAGVIDQTMQWALEDTPGHVINYQNGKLPWEDTELYIDGSPLFDLGKVKTPTLIHVGADDQRVPAAHARTLFRALSRYTNVPTELVVYPDTGHSPMTYTFRKAKMEWDIAWFDRYLMGNQRGKKTGASKD